MEDESPAKQKCYFNFSVRELMLAVACFAVSTAIIIGCLTAPPSPDIGDIGILMLSLFSPAIGASMGLGIGFLTRQKMACTIVGFIVPAVLLAIAMSYIQ